MTATGSAMAVETANVATRANLMADRQVETLLAGILKVPASSISDNLTMKDVEAWDSLQHMELIASLEEAFQVELTFDEIVAMTSVGQIKQVLVQRGVAV